MDLMPKEVLAVQGKGHGSNSRIPTPFLQGESSAILSRRRMARQKLARFPNLVSGHEDGARIALDDAVRQNHALDVFRAWDFVHDVQHHLLDDGPQSSCSGL